MKREGSFNDQVEGVPATSTSFNVNQSEDCAYF